MNIIKVMMLAFAVSFSANTWAENTTEQRDKSLERRQSGETMIMRDCLGRNGNDKELCEQETLNGTTSAVPNNSRLTRERNRRNLEDIQSRERARDRSGDSLKDIDSNSPDSSPRDTKPMDKQSTDIRPSDTRSN